MKTRRLQFVGAMVVLLLLAGEADVPALEDEEATALDRMLIQTASEVIQDPSSPESVLQVIEMTKLWDVTTPGLFEEQVSRLEKIKKLHPEAKLRLLDARREESTHRGDFDEASARVQDSGIITRWLMVGPFDNENRQGFEVEYGPEDDPGEPFDTGLAFQGDERPVSWRQVDAVPITGRLDFGNHVYPSTRVCAYAGTYLEVPKSQSLVVWAAAGGSLRLWVDQTLVVKDDAYRPTGLDRQAASVKLARGTHRVLTKVCVDDGPFNVVVRLTDAKGRPVQGLATPNPQDPYEGPSKPPSTGEVNHGFAWFARRLKQDPDDAEALADMARYMVLTHSDDLTETLAGDHAQRAVEIDETCEHLLLLAMATDDADIGLNALRDCTILEPDNEKAAFFYAAAMKSNTGGADFSNHVLDLVRRFPDDLRIQLLWVQEYVDLGLHSTAYAQLTDLRTRFGDVPDLLRASEYLASTAMSAEEALDWKRRLLSVRGDEQSAIYDMAETATARGEDQDALALLDRLFAMWPEDRGLISFAARKHVQMGDLEGARALYERATSINPHHPGEWEQLGNFYRLVGEDDLALAAFQMVLELNPNNVSVREYLAHLFPKSKFEKEFIVSRDEILAMNEALEAEEDPVDARDIHRYDVTVLVDQQVDRVYGNGMSSRFAQQAIRINSEQGEKMFRYVPITYAPLREDLDVIQARVYRTDGSIDDMVGRYSFPTFDPAVRVYYDMVREVIEFPALRKGDIIDVQYKVSDATARNMFERHFGTAVPVQSPAPTIQFRYGLICPVDMGIYTDAAAGTLLDYSEKERQGDENDSEPTVLRVWNARDVEAVEEEPSMPPLAEVSPLIKVSTFSSWEEFGRWWWGLASSQMVADKTIRDRVSELTGGLESDEEKVAAIFDWVTRSTRYIALEFGVHGYKPYPAPQVVSRGFGDCKDKATLLYVMFREAGIDASLALVRTRHAGEIGTDFPFQFQFDHVIAYVPGLDLFLDGTVDYLGIHDLPSGDQDVFALIVDETSVTPRRTPRMDYEDARVETDATFQLDTSGDASVTGKVTIRGASKAWYRRNYQNEGTQGERLEQQLSAIFPGLTMDGWEFEGLDDYSQDVLIRFQARIPNFALAHEGSMQFSILPTHDLFQSFASLSKRRHDVLVGYPRIYVDTHRYVAPGGWEFTEIPDDLDMGKEGQDFWFAMTSTGEGTATAEFSASLGFDTYRVEQQVYDPFRTFCSNVDDVMGQRAHLSEVTP